LGPLGRAAAPTSYATSATIAPRSRLRRDQRDGSDDVILVSDSAVATPTRSVTGEDGSMDGPIGGAAEIVLAGQLLVATPLLGDAPFSRTVVAILEHGEESGALGVVLNR